MSANKVSPSAYEAAIPQPFQSDMFSEHPGMRFAIGVVAVRDVIVPGCEKAYESYLQLRANVYDQEGFIPEDHILSDGTEQDEDDRRSVHFAVFEQSDEGVQAVGALRLIVKTESDNQPLPVERFFADGFASYPAPIGSSEASRYIAHPRNSKLRHLISGMLLVQGTAYIEKNGLGPTYGTANPAFGKLFDSRGVPYLTFTSPRDVAEYNSTNVGIVIDTKAYEQTLKSEMPAQYEAMQQAEGAFVFFGRQAVRHATLINSAVATASPVEGEAA